MQLRIKMVLNLFLYAIRYNFLKNAKGGLFLSFLLPVPTAKHGQIESLSA